MKITHNMDLSALAERMGTEANHADAEAMAVLLLGSEYADTENIPEDEWLELCAKADSITRPRAMGNLNARFSAAHEYFGSIKAGRDALATYTYWRSEGRSHDEAEILASNVLQRAGYNVNARGGISIDTDEPAEPAEPDEPDDPREHAHIHLRVLAETKGRWVRQSREEGKKLTDWIVEKVEGNSKAIIEKSSDTAKRYDHE